MSYALSLQTTNPFKDCSESWPECALSQSKGTQSITLKWSQKREVVFSHASMPDISFPFGHLVFSPTPLLKASRKTKREEQHTFVRKWGQRIAVLHKVPFECGCASQDVPIKQHLQSTSFSSLHLHQGGQQLPRCLCLRSPVVQPKLNFAAHGSSLGCSSWWKTREESDLLFLLAGIGQQRDNQQLVLGPSYLLHHTYALPPPLDPSLALQGPGTDEEEAEQQLPELPLPEHTSALPRAGLFFTPQPSNLVKTAQLKKCTGGVSLQWKRIQEGISYKVKNVLKEVFY